MGDLGSVIYFRELMWGAAGMFVAFISGLGVVYGAVRFGLLPGLHALRAAVHKFEAAAALIEAQLTTNGGASLLDKIHHIDECLTAGCPLFGDTGVCPRGMHLPDVRM